MSRMLATACLLLALPAPGEASAEPAAAAGGLAWERTTIDAAAKPGERAVSFEFRFENRGGRPVTLISAEASCRCVAVDAPLKAFGPGEKGVLRAAFSVGPGRGVQVQSITVTTDEPGASPVELTLRMAYPGASR
jgi:Protein of unknown function (DUF1573)